MSECAFAVTVRQYHGIPLLWKSGVSRQENKAGVWDSNDKAVCPIPEMLTGANAIPAPDHKVVNAYSDFLLHDVGNGDGVVQGAVYGNEFRTSPFWGLRFRKLLMHDGRARNPVD
jgi:CxxC motif-containing protein (DUF1111 family)